MQHVGHLGGGGGAFGYYSVLNTLPLIFFLKNKNKKNIKIEEEAPRGSVLP